MVEFTGFLDNKFRVKAVSGDNLVSGNILKNICILNGNTIIVLMKMTILG